MTLALPITPMKCRLPLHRNKISCLRKSFHFFRPNCRNLQCHWARGPFESGGGQVRAPRSLTGYGPRVVAGGRSRCPRHHWCWHHGRGSEGSWYLASVPKRYCGSGLCIASTGFECLDKWNRPSSVERTVLGALLIALKASNVMLVLITGKAWLRAWTRLLTQTHRQTVKGNPRLTPSLLVIVGC